jgi:hypothetical protein
MRTERNVGNCIHLFLAQPHSFTFSTENIKSLINESMAHVFCSLYCFVAQSILQPILNAAMVTACTDVVVSAAVTKPGKTQQLEPQENKYCVFQV